MSGEINESVSRPVHIDRQLVEARIVHLMHTDELFCFATGYQGLVTVDGAAFVQGPPKPRLTPKGRAYPTWADPREWDRAMDEVERPA